MSYKYNIGDTVIIKGSTKTVGGLDGYDNKFLGHIFTIEARYKGTDYKVYYNEGMSEHFFEEELALAEHAKTPIYQTLLECEIDE